MPKVVEWRACLSLFVLLLFRSSCQLIWCRSPRGKNTLFDDRSGTLYHFPTHLAALRKASTFNGYSDCLLIDLDVYTSCLTPRAPFCPLSQPRKLDRTRLQLPGVLKATS